ncbi:MAG: hypothetical protein LQ340_000276 [Diploschistes diacapsis]|nr:MAG: hypothetical protein LQ340_000276 [Diploschistes diacapsis]
MAEEHLLAGKIERKVSAAEVARQVYRQEGFGSFFRGLGVCSVRAFIVNAVQLVEYFATYMVPAVDVKSPMATSPRAWDFSAALEILSAPIASVSRSSSDTASRLEVSTDDISLSKANPSGESKNDALEDAPEVPILGNFDLVWDFLKSDAGPQHLSAYTVPETNHSSSPLLDSDIGDAPCLASNVSKDIGGFMKQRSGPTPSHKILIGFHDKLKLRMGLRKDHRIPRQSLSFHKLSLILERGRPVAKKLLAGSDNLDSIQEAKAIGYGTHILARVEKPDKEGPPAMPSDSDSARPLRSTRKGEQAVDEILQLHIGNSIIDNDEPSTIILASGDAAQGEFSDGFLKSVERALRRGWNVEIVAWKANISFAYRNPAWIARWGAAFRVIELDDFAELLRVDRVT